VVQAGRNEAREFTVPAQRKPQGRRQVAVLALGDISMSATNQERVKAQERACVICGCTEQKACMTHEGPCHWVVDGLCSACGKSDDYPAIGKFILVGRTPVRCENLIGWARWFEKSRKKRIVAQERVGRFRVSTVFLALDHNFSLKGPPVLFETMVFPLTSLQDVDCDRYSTWEEAEKGHRAMVERVRRGEVKGQ
jgi:hypothetical protein